MSAKRRQRAKKSTAKPKSPQAQPRKPLDLAQSAEPPKTPTSAAPNAVSRSTPKRDRATAAREADARQARFVAGVAALAFVVGVLFFFAGQTSRRLAPPSKPEDATLPTPQKLADAVAAEVEKARSEAIRRRAIVETSARDASESDETLATAAVASVPTDAATDSDVALADETVPSAETLAFVVELNSASKAELTNLPRVGEKLAERIIERREELGGFRSVDDLLGVKGIGEKTLDKMRPFCVVAPLDAAE